MELRDEYLVCYSNHIESVGLRKCRYDHQLTNKAYFERYHRKKHFSEFYPQDGGENQLA